jgi:hypothetical protein
VLQELSKKVRWLRSIFPSFTNTAFPSTVRQGSRTYPYSLVPPAWVRLYPTWLFMSLNDGPSFVPLPKSQNPDRVRSNIDVFGFEISKEDIEKLDELDRGKDGAVTWNPIDVD